jgi:hypothetical protein
VVVDLGDRPRRTRRVLALAAALLVVLAVVGAAALVADDDRPLDVTASPIAADDRFPVFGHLPASLEGARVEANDGEGTHVNGGLSSFLPDTPVVQAAISRAAGDGSAVDVIGLVAGAEGLEDRVGPGRGEIEDLASGYRMAALPGNPGWVELYGPGTTVLVMGGPHVTALVREIAGTGLTATVGADGRPVLTLRDLPEGYTVTAPPAPPEDGKAEAAIDSEGIVDGSPPVPYVLAETGVGEPSLAVSGNSAGGSYRPVEVDGSPGYIAVEEDRTVVAWTAPNGVTLRLITDLEEDEALRVARGIELVDEATWRATYLEPSESGETTTTVTEDAPTTPDTTGPTETTEPITDVVGRPAPAFTRPSTDGGEVTYAGHWTVVAMTRGGCPGEWCADGVLDALVGLDHDPPPYAGVPAPPLLQLVAVVDESTGDGAEAAVAVGFDGPVFLAGVHDIMRTWAVDDLPAFAIVDPDGIVASVGVGQVTTEAIAQALGATDDGSGG